MTKNIFIGLIGFFTGFCFGSYKMYQELKPEIYSSECKYDEEFEEEYDEEINH